VVKNGYAMVAGVVKWVYSADPVSCRGELLRPCGSVIEVGIVRELVCGIGRVWVGVELGGGVVVPAVAVLTAVRVYWTAVKFE